MTRVSDPPARRYTTVGRDAAGHRPRHRRPPARTGRPGRGRRGAVAQPDQDLRLPQRPRAHGGDVLGRRLLPVGRPRGGGRGGLPPHRRTSQGRHHPRWPEHQPAGGRGAHRRRAVGRRGRPRRHPRPGVRRAGVRVRRAAARCRASSSTGWSASWPNATWRRTSGRNDSSCSTSCRRAPGPRSRRWSCEPWWWPGSSRARRRPEPFQGSSTRRTRPAGRCSRSSSAAAASAKGITSAHRAGQVEAALRGQRGRRPGDRRVTRCRRRPPTAPA